VWKFKTTVDNGPIFPKFDKNSCYAYTTYPPGFTNEVPILKLLSLKQKPEIVWQQEAEIGCDFHAEYFGDFYCSIDNKNLYKLDEVNGLSLFMGGTTQGRFIGPHVYLYDNPSAATAEKSGETVMLIATDVRTKEKLWVRPLPHRRTLSYYSLLPTDAEFILLISKDWDGFDVLSSIDGSTLYSHTFLSDYRQEGRFIATQDHVIYVLHRKKRVGAVKTTPDTKIYVHHKHSGDIVRIIDNVPFHQGVNIYYHFPSGIIYGGAGDTLFAMDPVHDEFFKHYEIDLGYTSYCRGIIGTLGNEPILFMEAHKDRQVSMSVVHFDTERREVTFKQSFDGHFHLHQHIEVNKGFLFITDRDSTTHIYEWVPD